MEAQTNIPAPSRRSTAANARALERRLRRAPAYSAAPPATGSQDTPRPTVCANDTVPLIAKALRASEVVLYPATKSPQPGSYPHVLTDDEFAAVPLLVAVRRYLRFRKRRIWTLVWPDGTTVLMLEPQRVYAPAPPHWFMDFLHSLAQSVPHHA